METATDSAMPKQAGISVFEARMLQLNASKLQLELQQAQLKSCRLLDARKQELWDKDKGLYRLARENADLQLEVLKWRKLMSVQNLRLASAEETASHYQENGQIMMAQLAACAADRADLERQIASLQAQAHELLSTRQAQQCDQQEWMTAKDQELQRMHQQVKDLTASQADTQTLLSQSQVELEAAERRAAELEGQLAAGVRAQAAQQQQLEQVRAALAAKEEALVEADARIRAAQAAAQAAEQHKAVAEQQKAMAEQQKAAAEQQKAAVERAHAELSTLSQAKQLMGQEREQHLHKMAEERIKLGLERSQVVESQLRSQVQGLQGQLDRETTFRREVEPGLRGQVQELQHQQASLQEELQQLRGKVSTKEVRIKQLEDMLQSKEEDLEERELRKVSKFITTLMPGQTQQTQQQQSQLQQQQVVVPSAMQGHLGHASQQPGFYQPALQHQPYHQVPPGFIPNDHFASQGMQVYQHNNLHLQQHQHHQQQQHYQQQQPQPYQPMQPQYPALHSGMPAAPLAQTQTGLVLPAPGPTHTTTQALPAAAARTGPQHSSAQQPGSQGATATVPLPKASQPLPAAPAATQQLPASHQQPAPRLASPHMPKAPQPAVAAPAAGVAAVAAVAAAAELGSPAAATGHQVPATGMQAAAQPKGRQARRSKERGDGPVAEVPTAVTGPASQPAGSPFQAGRPKRQASRAAAAKMAQALDSDNDDSGGDGGADGGSQGAEGSERAVRSNRSQRTTTAGQGSQQQRAIQEVEEEGEEEEEERPVKKARQRAQKAAAPAAVPEGQAKKAGGRGRRASPTPSPSPPTQSQRSGKGKPDPAAAPLQSPAAPPAAAPAAHNDTHPAPAPPAAAPVPAAQRPGGLLAKYKPQVQDQENAWPPAAPVPGPEGGGSSVGGEDKAVAPTPAFRPRVADNPLMALNQQVLNRASLQRPLVGAAAKQHLNPTLISAVAARSAFTAGARRKLSKAGGSYVAGTSESGGDRLPPGLLAESFKAPKLR